ncbi:MAG: hypothetical protein ABW061_08350, partial [Polyangiaceae bacterium]
VALFVAVSQHGNGVMGLQKQDFKVFENGTALDNDQIGLTLLPTTESATQHAALIVDMSKSLKPSERKSLSEALRHFIVRLRQREAVSLYAFDGAEKVHLVQEYSQDARAEPDEKDTSMDRLLSFSRRDASTSLYSAVIDGASKLDASLAAEGRPIQNGTMIVVALNPDSAGRVEEGKLRDFIDDSPHHYFLVTVGTSASAANLSFIGKNGEKRAGSAMTMGAPLNDIANAVDDDYFRNYLVAYCSPARAGTRDLRLQVTTRDDQGKENVGSYSTQIDATGFGPGCSSTAPPHFIAAKPKEKDTEKEHKAVASNARRAPKARPDGSDKVSSATPAAKSDAPAPIAEPPKGLGYE